MKSVKSLSAIILVLTVIFLASCSKEDTVIETTIRPVPGENNSSCAYLTKDNHGNPVLVWIDTAPVEKNESKDDHSHGHGHHGKSNPKGIVYFAISKDGGVTFENAVKVSTSEDVSCQAESMPKVAFANDGSIYAFFGKRLDSEVNKWASAVFYSVSIDNGETWSEPEMISSDKSPDNSRNFFDIANLPDGSIGVTWLDGREEQTGLYFAKTDVNGKFSSDKKNASVVCECCRTDILVDSKGNINIAYRDILKSRARDMGFVMSGDNGDTFSEPVLISNDGWEVEACPHTGPSMAEVDGRIYCTWFTRGNGVGLFYNFATIGANEFSLRNSLTSNQSAKHPQSASVKNGIVTVWEERSVNDDLKNVIVLNYMSSDGESQKVIISDENVSSSFPVILTLDEENVLISWTSKDENSEKVIYRKVNVNDIFSESI